MLEETLDNEIEKKISRVGFGPRLEALFLDKLILTIVILIIIIITESADIFRLLITRERILENLHIVYGDIFLYIMIFCFFNIMLSPLYGLIEVFAGSSYGKRILGYKIAFEDGTSGNFSLYLKRWILTNSSVILFFINSFMEISWFDYLIIFISTVYFIGCFFALGSHKQSLHDMILKTAVYKKKLIVKSIKEASNVN
jgi:uncharacterized RDD family membrane protein YckC